MTPQEAGLLSDLGVSILLGATWLTTISILQGMFVLLFALSTVTIFHRGLATKASWGMFLVTVFCFLVATLHWSAEVSAFVIIVRSALVDNLDMSQAEKQPYANLKAQKANIIVVWTQLLPIISDSVVVWRAWAIFVGQRWIMTGPILLLLSAISMTFAFLGYSVRFSASGNESVTSAADFILIANIYTSRIALSLATNVVATLLIGYKLWTHRGVVVNNLGLPRRASRGQKVLLLLIESGTLYCALQAVNVALSLASFSGGNDSPPMYAAQILFAAYTEISAMYPTIVILLVHTQRSFVDTYGFTAVFNKDKPHDAHNIESRPATAGHLSFAMGRTKSDTSTDIRSTHDEPVDFSDKPLSSVTRIDGERYHATTAPF